MKYYFCKIKNDQNEVLLKRSFVPSNEDGTLNDLYLAATTRFQLEHLHESVPSQVELIDDKNFLIAQVILEMELSQLDNFKQPTVLFTINTAIQRPQAAPNAFDRMMQAQPSASSCLPKKFNSE